MNNEINGIFTLKKKWNLVKRSTGYVLEGVLNLDMPFTIWGEKAEALNKINEGSTISIKGILKRKEIINKVLVTKATDTKPQKQEPFWDRIITINEFTLIKPEGFSKLDKDIDVDWGLETKDLLKQFPNKPSSIANLNTDEIILSDDESILWD